MNLREQAPQAAVAFRGPNHCCAYSIGTLCTLMHTLHPLPQVCWNWAHAPQVPLHPGSTFTDMLQSAREAEDMLLLPSNASVGEDVMPAELQQQSQAARQRADAEYHCDMEHRASERW